MAERNGLMSLFSDRKIGTKVGLGFVCVLAILAVVSATAWSAFQSSAQGFSTYAQRVMVVGIARDIDRSFLNLRRFVREYAATGQDAEVESVKAEEAVLRPLLRRGLDEIRNPERHQRVEDIARQVDGYLKDFEQVVGRNHELVALRRDTLDRLGPEQRQRFEALIEAAGRAGDANVALLGNAALIRLMSARIDVNKLLGRHDAAAGAAADKDFGELDARLQAIDAATRGTDYQGTVDALRAGAAGYRDAFERARALEGEIGGLVNGAMSDKAKHVQADAEAIKASGIAEERAQEAATLATLDSTSELVLGLSLGGLVLGAAFAWAIGRGIAGPVVRMCAAMRALAGGDTSVAIPGLGRKDEVGQMAATVQVFKDSMIESERLRAEQEAQKAAAQEERRAALRKLADGFEGQVGSVIQAVSTATAQLQTVSKQMQENAARTSAEATSVASSSTEAAANAQAVASASEELSASISEIAKQVESARVISSRADAEGKQTTDQVHELSQTVATIGAIVALINDIASQTNLLALNATIEAARAGDAGKGFAVVASEVKNLASQTARATEEISGKINAVQSGTEKAAKAIGSITRVMSEMSAISAAIAAAVEQQSTATAEIARNVEQSAAGSQDVSQRIAQVDVAARETGAVAVQISASAAELSTQAQTLRSEVGRFLEQVRSDRDTMHVLAWDAAWTTGDATIDRHHRDFMGGINELFRLLMSGEGRAAVPRMAKLIEEGIDGHFAEEEELMRRHRYAGLAAHQQAHKAIRAKFADVLRTLEAGGAIDAAEFFDFVSNWFKAHMREYDVPLARAVEVRRAA